MTKQEIKEKIREIGTQRKCTGAEYLIQRKLIAQNERGPLSLEYCLKVIADWNALHHEEVVEEEEEVKPTKPKGTSYDW